MSISDEIKRRIGAIADDALCVFESVVEAARAQLLGSSAANAGAFANINTLTSPNAVPSLQRINEENQKNFQTQRIIRPDQQFADSGSSAVLCAQAEG